MWWWLGHSRVHQIERGGRIQVFKLKIIDRVHFTLLQIIIIIIVILGVLLRCESAGFYFCGDRLGGLATCRLVIAWLGADDASLLLDRYH